MNIENIADKIKAKVADSGFDRSVKFDCGDEGVIVVNGETVTTEDENAECTISLSKEDLVSMINGDLDPTAAFMQGKIKVAGDMSVAMSLSQVM